MLTQIENKTKFKPMRINRLLHYLFLLITVIAMTFPSALVPMAVPVEAAGNPAPVQTFYVTLPEADGLTVLNTINSAAVTPMYTYFSIAVGVDGTTSITTSGRTVMPEASPIPPVPKYTAAPISMVYRFGAMVMRPTAARLISPVCR